MSEEVVAALTALFGVIVFVIGQTLQRFFIEPLQEQRKLIGEIAFALVFYANVGGPESSEDKKVETITSTRDLGSRLRASLYQIPLYSLFSLFGFVPKRRRVIEASKNLVGWSNSVYHGTTQVHRDKVAEALKIEWIA